MGKARTRVTLCARQGTRTSKSLVVHSGAKSGLGGRAGGRALTSVCEVLSARGLWSQNREGIKSILQGMSVICHVTVCKTN